MERLTERYTPELVYLIGNGQTYNTRSRSKMAKALDRLAAYEDTGLTPEEARCFGRLVRGERMVTEEDLMASGVSPAEIQRLMDIVTAEAEGRLLVLPCKVGDTVYRLNRTPYGKRFMDAYPELEVYAYQVTTIYGEKPGLILFAHRLLNGSITTSYVTFSGEDFGKTVFLTREEAEAALRFVMRG